MIHFINILFLGYVIIWPLFSRSVAQLDGAGRIYMFLGALVMLLNFPNEKFRRVLKSPICWIWLIWILYSVANNIRAGIPPPGGISLVSFVFVYLIIPFISMWIAAYEMMTRPRELMSSLMSISVLYLVWGLFYIMISPSTTERAGQILGNEFALAALAIVAFACLSYSMSLIKGWTWVFLVLLSTMAIFLVATRKAFSGELILLFMFYISRNNKFTLGNVLKSLVMLLIAYWAISYVMENTMMGERFNTIEDEAEKYNTTNSWFLSLLGDRALFYIKGWALFLQHPLYGIGLNNFMTVTDYPMPIHSEYMVQLVENGIIGFIIYLFFVMALFKCSRRIQYIRLKGVALGWILCVLFISFTSWTYDMSIFFIVFGLILGIQKQKNSLGRL